MSRNRLLCFGIFLIVISGLIIGILYFGLLHTQHQDNNAVNPPYVEGTVINVEKNGSFENATVYSITLDNQQSYQMLFRTSDAMVPPTDVTLRFYYTMIDTYYDIIKIKSL
jgi:hypothetical protein